MEIFIQRKIIIQLDIKIHIHYILNRKKKYFISLRISDFLRVNKKRRRAKWILQNYNSLTPRNGKYTKILYKKKVEFEDRFFQL